MCKKDCNWNSCICICENNKHLKRIVDESVVLCDGITNGTSSVSTNVTNTIPTYVTSIVPINSDEKNSKI